MKPRRHKFGLMLMIALTGLLLCATLPAQSPQKMSYQAVIRNAGGALLPNQNVGIRIQILQGSEYGAAVYVERHTRTTNVNGLATLEIGGGTVVMGSFSGINWAGGPYFLKTEIDPAGGTSYNILGTTELLSVPYALYAKSVATETDPVFTVSSASGITGTNITNWNTAFGWGNHSGLYRPVSWVPSWADVTSKPTAFNPSAHSHSATDVIAGTLAVARGGTGISVYTAGTYIYASGATTLGQRTPSQVRADIGAGTVTSIGTGNGITGGTITTTGTLGLTGQALALHNLGTSGIIVRTGAGTVAARTITAGTGITVTNGNGVSGNPTVAAKTYAIGNFAHGGIVFWVDETGQHGLVCAKKDIPNLEPWDSGNSGNNGCTGDGLLAGKMNTAILIARILYEAEAARMCYRANYTEGGKTYGDWYLPSKEELNLMYQNKTTINWNAVFNGGNSFADGRYWSSTESTMSYAWTQDFVTGVQNQTDKSSKFYVRAVRSF